MWDSGEGCSTHVLYGDNYGLLFPSFLLWLLKKLALKMMQILRLLLFIFILE